MKKLVLFLLPVIFFSCNNVESPSAATDVADTNFDWLLTDWQRINEQEDRQTFESWSKKDNSEYHGIGYTLKNSDTIWKETMKLVESNQTWSIEITGNGELKPTVFKLTKIEQEQFTSENPGNEFPKLIKYSRQGNQLKAVISDGEMEIPFEFKNITLTEK